MNTSKNSLFKETPTPEKDLWLVGVFDVLGFSARVKKDGVDKVYNDYQSLLKNVLNKPAIDTGGMYERVPEAGAGAGVFSMGGEISVNSTYFSDTILLWLPFKPGGRKIFLQRCADLICEALVMRIPLRGAIALGEGYMHKATGIYLGQHIVDAARLEEAQEQLGIGLTMSAASSPLIPSVEPTQYIEYDIPIKQDLSTNEKPEYWSPCVLDWARHWRNCEYGDLIQCLTELRPKEERFAKYYNNAIKFVEWSIAHNDWHKYPEKQSDFKYIKPYNPKKENGV